MNEEECGHGGSYKFNSELIKKSFIKDTRCVKDERVYKYSNAIN